MKDLKRIRYYLLAFVFLLFITAGAYAARVLLATPAVSIPTEIAASPGGTVDVPINITGVSGAGIGGFSIRLNYDSTILSNPTVIKEGTLTADYTIETYAPPADGIGKLSLGNSLEGFSPTADGILVKVRFNVWANFTGTSAITIESDNVKSTLFKANLTQITGVTWTDGSVKAVDSTGPTTSTVKTDGVTNLNLPQGTTSLTLTALVSDATTGNNNIQAAEYFIGATDGANGAGVAMTAADGGFNTPAEAVTASVNTSAWTAANSPYTLRVHGQDSAGNWGATQTVQIIVYQAPAAPTLNPITSPTRNVRPTGTWNAVTGAAKYDVQVATDTNFTNIVATGTGLTTTSFTGTADAVDGTYYWRVRAIDSSDHAGAWSAVGSFTVDTTAPAAVTGLTATPIASGDIQLGWTNPTADFVGVILVGATGAAPTLAPTNGTAYTAGTNGVIVVGNLNSYTETPLVHGTHRYYKVFAYDSLYNYSAATSVDATGSDTAPPAAVTGFIAAPGDTKVTLGWTNPTDADFAGVIVLYKQGSAPTSGPTQWTAYNVGDAIGDATVGYKGTATTTQITSLTNNSAYYFTIYAYDERPNYSAGAAANATPVPFGITTPAALTVDVKVGQTVNLSATGSSGSYKWTATGGTLSAATGANVTWTAPATVTTSPTSYTITLTDGVTPTLTDTRTIRVYSSVGITNKPATSPTIQPGASSTAFTVSGGDSTQYTWTVTDRAGTTIGTPQTGTSFTFTTPNAGAFAGEYTITVTDNLGLTTDSFKVKVPITITPTSWTFKATDAAKTFTVAGAGSTYTWDIMGSATATTAVTTPADYGTWSGTATTTVATNNFTPNAAVTAVKTFFLRVTVTDDLDLTTTNGLDKLTVGPFNIIPVTTYTVNVKNAAGTALNGATVTVNVTGQTAKTTDATGKATFSLPSTGGKYLYNASLAGYVSQSVTSALTTVDVTLQSVGSTITGTISDATPLAIAGATVTAYLPAAVATQYTATTAADGTYTINLPTGAATTGWTVVATKTGYTAASQTGVASGASGINITLATVVGTAPDVNLGGGTKTATAGVEVPAGGLTTTGGGFIIITPNANTSPTTFTSASPTNVYEVKITSDAAGTTPVTTTDIKRVVITIPVNLSVVKPGDLENGVYAIYSATSLANLLAGTVSAVPAANIISTDYVGNGSVGSVTFWVDHLSFFGIGGGSGGGGSSSGAEGEGCFIATAAYGSYFDKHVQILRDFRDVYLMPNKVGRAFVDLYYTYSPALANFISKHDGVRTAVRWGLAPVIGMSYVALYTSPVQKLLILLLFIGILTGGFLVIKRFRRVY